MKIADPEMVERLAASALSDLRPSPTGRIPGVYRWARQAPQGAEPHEQRGAPQGIDVAIVVRRRKR